VIERQYVPAHVLERVQLKLPFWRYYELFRGKPFSFLLDSASEPTTLGRYSFIGGDPFMVFRAKRVKTTEGKPHLANIRIQEGTGPGAIVTEYQGDPLDELRQLLAAHDVRREQYAGRPVPLLSGAVGYFGYEAGYFIENMADIGSDDLDLPDIHVGLYNSLLAHCHRTKHSYISVLGRGPNERMARERAMRKRDALLEAIAAFEKDPPPAWEAPKTSTKKLDAKHISEKDYCDLVQKTREHIFAGDIFEMCLTHRIESPFKGDTWKLYSELRRINPAPFACYLELPEATLVSSSPERFLRLGSDRTAESRPIKGTRPRGATEEEDQRLYLDLQNTLKDQAENNMIVDLVRNDFGRVCRFGSVHVPELRIIERYATVYQMVSTIRGQLDEGHDTIDLLRACFPGGSMTGAPKIEAMRIIDTLEPVKRSVYSGSIGYVDFSGSIDFNIVIRTIIVKNGTAYYNVGGAIVADSEPKAEYQETLDKARALMQALANVGSE
jgi:para-aminobenzoate synthetase component 1